TGSPGTRARVSPSLWIAAVGMRISSPAHNSQTGRCERRPQRGREHEVRPRVAADLDRRKIPVEPRVGGTLLTVVANREVVHRGIDAEGVPGRVIGCERPVVAAIPAATAIGRLPEFGIR